MGNEQFIPPVFSSSDPRAGPTVDLRPNSCHRAPPSPLEKIPTVLYCEPVESATDISSRPPSALKWYLNSDGKGTSV